MRVNALGSLTAALLIHITLLAGCVAPANATPEVDGIGVELGRPMPASVAVPKGQQFAFAFLGRGVQIYQCGASGSDGAVAWTLVGPRATLLDRQGRNVGTHYAGPTWEMQDGSKVSAKKVAEAAVDETSVSWLLLQAAAHEGSGRMSDVTYIQRLKTQSGRAPASECSAGTGHEGERREVPYSAWYVFYRQASAR